MKYLPTWGTKPSARGHSIEIWRYNLKDLEETQDMVLGRSRTTTVSWRFDGLERFY